MEVNRVVYLFWTGTNPMSNNRKNCLDQFIKTCGVKSILITNETLAQYILPDHPLHEAYQYLSETHKADYLRTYFMHFYGGGYSDVKQTTDNWTESFNRLENKPDKWIIGYREFSRHGVASTIDEIRNNFYLLVGNGAYICRPQTPLTQEWYTEMMSLLDTKLDLLKKYPATNPQDCKEKSNYPIEWNEMLGRIFHKVCYKYTDHLLYTLPISIFNNYR